MESAHGSSLFDLSGKTARDTLSREDIEALSIPCDAGVDSELDCLVAETEAGFGPVDILVCKAGINRHSGSLTQASDEEYDAIMHINLRSAMQLCNRVIPGLAARKDGAVILTSSISGLRRNGRIGV
jgi:NAD(P)-dependent dehydrogenase (short-subunit alcohol dehydrogenase family)